jgi:DNA-binding NarL/FixJ family response regulator
LADDNPAIRDGLCALLENAGSFAVVGQAKNGREAVRMECSLKPDVVLMDIAMPVLNGLDATRQILAANPDAKVLIVSSYCDDAYLESMWGIGAVGYLNKMMAATFLGVAVSEVAAGRTYFSPDISKRMREIQSSAARIDLSRSEESKRPTSGKVAVHNSARL